VVEVAVEVVTQLPQQPNSIQTQLLAQLLVQ
jgi:hypothetical protein